MLRTRADAQGLVLGDDVVIGDGVLFGAHVVVGDGTRIGEGSVIEHGVVLGKSTWSVLALTCHIELFTQAHYRASIGADATLSDLWKDVFLYHWREESQHAVLDELEWQRADAKLTPAERDSAVDDLIGRWRGQGGVALGGGREGVRLVASRRRGRLSAGFVND